MHDIVSILIRSAMVLVDGIMGIFGILHWTDKHLSESSRVGKSSMDQKRHDIGELILDSWFFFSLMVILILSLIGGFIWLY